MSALATTEEPRLHDSPGRHPKFVRVRSGRFEIEGRPHRFVGANLWYAAYLGADAEFGDRARLERELDRLRALGVTNVRILGGGELSPLESSLRPAFRDASSSYDEELLGGLDFALSALGRRGMRAVLYLTNFWEWSGGMATYLAYTNGGHYVERRRPDSWPAFPDFAATFYASEPAVALYLDYVRALVTRRNRTTGVLYSEDPTIFSFQLANEPRPGESPEVVARNRPAFLRWIRDTARLLRQLAPHHLVSTGSEGLAGCAGATEDVLLVHGDPNIDYLTAHLWPQNWGWVEPTDLEGTFARGLERARGYLELHEELATRLGRPLVLEEFGFPRDGEGFAPSTTTTLRDRFYSFVFESLVDGARRDGPFSGANFWAFGGEGRAEHADFQPRRGDHSYLGDPPHEPQGWYSVFDTDHSTLALLRTASERLAL